MTPSIVTPPASLPVEMPAMRLHLRVDHTEDDTLIEALVASATAHLDGWTGVLGRCIMPQTWKITADAGEIVLPMPDVTAATAAYEAGTTALAITATALGPCVTLTEACDVTFTCGLPARLLPAAQAAIKLLVGHWYANREAIGDVGAEIPLAVDSLVTAMRWRQF